MAWQWYRNICGCNTDILLPQASNLYLYDILGSMKYDLIILTPLNVVVINGLRHTLPIVSVIIFTDQM